MSHPHPELLSLLLDGDLPPDRVRELEHHLQECDRCRDLLRELTEVGQRARALPDREPERDLWPAIQEGIRQEISQEKSGEPDVIPLHGEGSAPSPSSRRRFSLSLPQAAAAGLVLCLLSGALGAFLARPTGTGPLAGAEAGALWIDQVPDADPRLERAAREVARLEGILARQGSALEGRTAEILEKNLAIIDEAIRESVAALRTDPGNPFLRDHLTRAVQSKEDYLREAAELVAPLS
jgi:hypothetical protein